MPIRMLLRTKDHRRKFEAAWFALEWSTRPSEEQSYETYRKQFYNLCKRVSRFAPDIACGLFWDRLAARSWHVERKTQIWRGQGRSNKQIWKQLLSWHIKDINLFKIMWIHTFASVLSIHLLLQTLERLSASVHPEFIHTPALCAHELMIALGSLRHTLSAWE